MEYFDLWDSCMIKSLKPPKCGNQLRFLIQRVPSGHTSNALSIPHRVITNALTRSGLNRSFRLKASATTFAFPGCEHGTLCAIQIVSPNFKSEHYCSQFEIVPAFLKELICKLLGPLVPLWNQIDLEFYLANRRKAGSCFSSGSVLNAILSQLSVSKCLVSKYLNGMEDILDDGDSMEARKITVAKSKPFIRFSMPYDVDGQGAWDAELDMADSYNYITEERFDQLVIGHANEGEPSVLFGRDFLVTSKSRVNFRIGEMRIDLTMLEEIKKIDAMLDALGENLEEVGSSNGDLVKMGKASRNKNHKVNKLTLPPQIKIEEIPTTSTIAPPSPIYHPLTQKQKEKVKEVLDSKYKELEEPKPILDVLENYMTYRKQLDEVLMGRARLNSDDYGEEKVNGMIEMNALSDMGASVSVLPYCLFINLGLGDLNPYNSNLTMAYNTQAKTMGEVKNRTCGAVIDMGRSTLCIDDGVIRYTYFPKPRTKAYLDNFVQEEEDDWLSCFEVGRYEDGNPKYGPIAPLFLDIEDDMEIALAMKAYFNPFKNIIVFKKFVDFLDDQINSVINCLTAKSTWDDLILYHEGPFDVKESRVIDMKLCYNTFKFKEGESLTQTFTRYKALMNELVNNGIKLLKLEINSSFINGLPKKWLAFCQSRRNTNHVKEFELASLFGKLKYEENLINSIYDTNKEKTLVPATHCLLLYLYCPGLLR
ncbi:hypothetical protein Tco_0826576 [Tanacetum coccineum]